LNYRKGGAYAPPFFVLGGLFFLVAGLLGGCSALPDTGELIESAKKQGWRESSAGIEGFRLRYLYRLASTSNDRPERLTVYFEGDGNAWLSPTRVSPDPTPKSSQALSLALSDHMAQTAAYVARPCQFHLTTRCHPRYWTSDRYNEAVVRVLDKLLDQLKAGLGVTELELIGWSGGGTLATLISARRNDVSGLITAGANLDLRRWEQERELTPLSGSINPADLGARVSAVPQVHFSGSTDERVPASIVRSYLSKIGLDPASYLIVVPGHGHFTDWSVDWPHLVETARASLRLQRQ
jgi:pimeloyl-ACP methyl ester carboxylesterase